MIIVSKSGYTVENVFEMNCNKKVCSVHNGICMFLYQTLNSTKQAVLNKYLFSQVGINTM